ncbi:Acetyltransferase (GNAT) domain-containing protein [Lishizhenia tianjinensis]|uniref:Acetyltransferase (GNAT) domain-containing protein n=1 Tax=Lishizhenia tianjinensis TaxID=477690 RepID=A0A1I7BVV3_9FLAO|nr:GNAT family N-acetyltransferase [Lishizhenia tianjinensis]SFT91231.1 Acetyltransferase (GNAT) domain-containing protein [Lishizhenia tianjinensis]
MVTYRIATPDDYENINNFHNRIYKKNRTMEQFYWEFHNGPFGASIYVIAEDEGKVVGTNCVIPIDLITAENKIIRSGKSEDTLVDPDYRGQKIFYKIYDFLFEKCREANIEVIWGFTAAKKPFKNLEFEIPFDHQQSLAVNKIWKSYLYLAGLNPQNKFMDKLKIFGLCTLSKFKTLGKLGTNKSKFDIKVYDTLTEGVDELIFEGLQQSRENFAILQSANFQQWRIYDNPNYFKTHTYGIYEQEKLIALMVFNSHENGIAYLCQASFRGKLSDTEKANIIKSVTARLFKSGISAVRTWMFDTNPLNKEEAELFQTAGYVHLNRGIGFVWKELTQTGVNPKNFIVSRMATQGAI